MKGTPLLLLGLALAGPAVAQDSPAASPSAAPAGPLGFALPSLEEMAATRERPLFSPTRRPPPPPPPPAPPPAPVAVVEEPEPEPELEPPPFALAGVVSGPGTLVAVLRNTGTQTVERARKGEVLEGWTVAEIGARHVLLRRDGEDVRLGMFENPTSGGGSGAADEDEEDMEE